MNRPKRATVLWSLQKFGIGSPCVVVDLGLRFNNVIGLRVVNRSVKRYTSWQSRRLGLVREG